MLKGHTPGYSFTDAPLCGSACDGPQRASLLCPARRSGSAVGNTLLLAMLVRMAVAAHYAATPPTSLPAQPGLCTFFTFARLHPLRVRACVLDAFSL